MSYLCPRCGEILIVRSDGQRGQCRRCDYIVDLRYVTSTPFRKVYHPEEEMWKDSLEWRCDRCWSTFPIGSPKNIVCPVCKKVFNKKENDMKKVFEYVIHNETEIFTGSKVLADDEIQARILIGSRKEADFTDPDVKVVVRPFCDR